MRCGRVASVLMNPFLVNWLSRHQHPVSRWFHFLAIPLMPVAAVLGVSQVLDGAWELWWRPVGLLGISYAIQWAGHVIEGNDMGEVVLIKKLLGRPYVAIAPRYQQTPKPASEAL